MNSGWSYDHDAFLKETRNMGVLGRLLFYATIFLTHSLGWHNRRRGSVRELINLWAFQAYWWARKNRL